MKLFTKFLLVCLFAFASWQVNAQTYNVTFKVDMSQYVGLNDTVYVNGTWNGWCGRCNPLVKQANSNVWEGTFAIPSGAQEYKFTIGGWSAQESLTQGIPCTVTNGGFTNRSINVTANTTLSTVCWNSCSACNNLLPMNLPVTFDATNVNYVLVDFGGNSSVIVGDPMDTSNKVAKVTKSNVAELWAGTTMGVSGFATPIPFAANATKMRVRVYSPDSGIVVRLKAELSTDASKSVETDARTTVSNAWEVLEFNFANPANGTAAINYTVAYNKLSIFFNFGTTGAQAGTKVYYFDNVSFVPPTGPLLKQIGIPINFDSTDVNYSMTDFGGNTSSVVVDPTNPNNKVGKIIKSNTAELWAGTTCSTPAGLASAIPFAQGSTTINLKVYSPDSGIVVRLKAEDPTDATKSVETDARTTTKNAWETLTFNFANHVAGTAAINYGYTYKMVSIFFNFGVTGAQAGEKTYYFDEVNFGAGSPPPPTTVDVTFAVDAKNLTLGANDVITLNGSFNGWCGDCIKMTKDSGSTTWRVTVPLDKSKEYEYKFTVGNWASQESLSPSLSCVKTTGAFTNRVMTTGTSNMTLPTVCWESCAACPTGSVPQTNVTFQVDMSKYSLGANDTVTLNGTFNNWCGACTPMTKLANSDIWTVSVMLNKDSVYDYKFVIGNWVAQESLKEGSSCTRTLFGFTNRTLTASKENDTLPVVCWESCVNCASALPKTSVTFQVNMKDFAGDLSKGVTLNGTFNGWCGDCTPMALVGNKVYEVTIKLDTGSHEFKYTIGNWDQQEQFNPGDPCTKTDGAFTNRIVSIKDTSAVKVGPYCWNTCTICEAVSIDELLLNSTSIYPNPAKDKVYIEFNRNAHSNVSMDVYDLLGAKVAQTAIMGAGNTLYELETKGISPGIYLVKVSVNGTTKSFKLIVE
jgi:hypothetical protein